MDRSSFTDRIDVTGSQLVDRVREIAQDANARRVRVLDRDGNELLVVPLGWGAAGGALTLFTAPWLVALAGIGAVVAKLSIEVERVTPDQPGAAGPQDTTDAGGTDPTGTEGWDAPPSGDDGTG